MQPEVGCGAAIRDGEGRLLLIQRLKEPEAGCWGLPGGKVDLGEAVEKAVAREIEEELGIRVAIERLACVTEMIDAGDGRHWVSPVYEARIRSGEPELREPEKHGGWGWFALSDLPEALTTPTRQYLATCAGRD